MTGQALDFAHRSQPMRVVLRPGAVPHAVAAETGRLGLRPVLVV
ncbi:hypothetical protein [Streptomyces sp. SAS_272]